MSSSIKYRCPECGNPVKFSVRQPKPCAYCGTALRWSLKYRLGLRIASAILGTAIVIAVFPANFWLLLVYCLLSSWVAALILPFILQPLLPPGIEKDNSFKGDVLGIHR